jgi:glycerol-1-phosphate dehydrogenase [NAD(P)+]
MCAQWQPETFRTISGRGLLEAIPAIVPRPYAAVTMADLRQVLEPVLDASADRVIEVESLEGQWLDSVASGLDGIRSLVGLGGGQALDAAKYLAWRKQVALFQVPTALTVNAAWSHRSARRDSGIVRYVGWTIPEAVFVDYDIIRSAPPLLNRSGAGDLLCYHTALWDWKFAMSQARCEPAWPYDEGLAQQSRNVLEHIVAAADEIRDISISGIDALVEGLAYGGAAFLHSGWNPRHIEGAEHFVYYALELVTARPLLHGQAVGFGILIASAMQNNDPDGIRNVLDRTGLPYTPAAMDVSWEQVREALDRLPEVIGRSNLWYTIASAREVTPALFHALREWIDDSSSPRWHDPE